MVGHGRLLAAWSSLPVYGKPVLPRLATAGRRSVRSLIVLAADLWGGVWANNTKACARWYERQAQTNGLQTR
jgi:hypothetical protein